MKFYCAAQYCGNSKDFGQAGLEGLLCVLTCTVSYSAVDLCQPVLVSQIEGEGDPEPDWIFLRVTAKHVIEVELKAARVLHKLELKCLQKVETSEMNWKRMVSNASE